MIALVEGANRQKTPNEIALTMLLAAMTLTFLIVCVTLPAIAGFVGVKIDLVLLVALLVCLIPTTIGGLLPAIGIAGMNRALRPTCWPSPARRWKWPAMSTCCCSTRPARSPTATARPPPSTRWPASCRQLREAALLSSLADPTPEGKSIVKLAREQGTPMQDPALEAARRSSYRSRRRRGCPAWT
jgi:K+-transporting ATPase ATPase B chain